MIDLQMSSCEARSSVVEHCFDVAGVSGSIPLVPTRFIKDDNKQPNK
jgi:hypothetical protein